MNIQQVKRGKYHYWTVDLRAQGKGRLFAPSKGEIVEKLRRELTGWTPDEIAFDASDRLAKHELAGKATLLECVRYYLAHCVQTEKQKSLADALIECVKEKRAMNLRPKYLKGIEEVIGTFTRYIAEKNCVNCSDVGLPHIKDFLASNNWAFDTRVGMRNKLGAFFSWSVEQGYCRENPVAKLNLGRSEKRVPKILTVEAVHRLLDTTLMLDPVMVPYFTLGIFCGIRPEELARLSPPCVQLERGIVDIPATVSKTRDRRIVDISENARAWIMASGKKLRWARKRFRDAVVNARIEWSHDVMRHTFASYHLEFHGSADKTAAQLGHHGSTRTFYRHYRATVEKSEAEAFWKIEPAICPMRAEVL